MQRLQAVRTKVCFSRSKSAGFTLVELMVVIGILTIVAAIAFAGFRQDEFSGQYKRFVADLSGRVVQARNISIDDQTRVRITVQDDRIQVLEWNDVTDTWVGHHEDHISVIDGAMLEKDYGSGPAVCLYGLTSGVQPPGAATAINPPNACVGGVQTIEFQPDGSFVDPDGSFATVQNAGATLWIADRRSATTKLSAIQIFPGGFTRTFQDLAN